MIDTEPQPPLRNPVPFYGSYASFIRMMKAFKEHGLPRRVSSRTLAPLLGEEAARVATHISSMGWVDEINAPSKTFRDLVDSFGEPNWQQSLLGMVREFYQFVPEPWEDLTAEKLHEAFLAYTGREARVLTSAETFFLSLALECQINLPDRLFLRANRAHLEARRSKEEADELELELPERKEELADTPKSATKGSQNTQKHGRQYEYAGQIECLSKLLVGATDMTDAERNAAVTLIGYFARAMNAA